jgi:hypothetical protein
MSSGEEPDYSDSGLSLFGSSESESLGVSAFGFGFLPLVAASRAAFYVRLFCGAVEAGLAIHDDFTCASQAARGKFRN